MASSSVPESLETLSHFLSQPDLNRARFDQIDEPHWINYLIHTWDQLSSDHNRSTFSFIFTDVLTILTGDYTKVHDYVAECTSVLRHRDSFSPDIVLFLRAQGEGERGEMSRGLARLCGPEFRNYGMDWLLQCAQIHLSVCLSLVTELGAERRTEFRELPQGWKSQTVPGPFEDRLRSLYGSSLPSLLGCTPGSLAWWTEPLPPPTLHPPPWAHPETPDTWPYTKPVSTCRYEEAPDPLVGDRKTLFEILEMAIPPVWSRVFYCADPIKFTDDLTNFSRVNSCNWIATFLKVFDIRFMRALQEVGGLPLKECHETLTKFLSLPSAPVDLETTPDFLLEPTFIMQLPFSVVLFQQWLAGALLEVTKFEAMSMELRHWPMVEYNALLSTALFSIIRTLKERLLIGIAVVTRDVVDYPKVHMEAPKLLLDELVLPSIPALRFLIRGEAYAILNNLKEAAFSVPFTREYFPNLKTVSKLAMANQKCLVTPSHVHYFHCLFWVSGASYPFPIFERDIAQVAKTTKLYEHFLPSVYDFVPELKEEEFIETKDLGEEFKKLVLPIPMEGAHWEEGVAEIYAMVAQLRRGKPSLLRSLVMMNCEMYLREQEVLKEKQKIWLTGVTPVLENLPPGDDMSLKACFDAIGKIKREENKVFKDRNGILKAAPQNTEGQDMNSESCTSAPEKVKIEENPVLTEQREKKEVLMEHPENDALKEGQEMEIVKERGGIADSGGNPSLQNTSETQKNMTETQKNASKVKERLVPDADTICNALDRIFDEMKTTNREWLHNNLPFPKKFDLDLYGLTCITESIMLENIAPKSLSHVIGALVWNCVLYVYGTLFELADQKISLRQFHQIYTLQCPPIIFLQAMTNQEKEMHHSRRLSQLVIAHIITELLPTFSDNYLDLTFGKDCKMYGETLEIHPKSDDDTEESGDSESSKSTRSPSDDPATRSGDASKSSSDSAKESGDTSSSPSGDPSKKNDESVQLSVNTSKSQSSDPTKKSSDASVKSGDDAKKSGDGDAKTSSDISMKSGDVDAKKSSDTSMKSGGDGTKISSDTSMKSGGDGTKISSDTSMKSGGDGAKKKSDQAEVTSGDGTAMSSDDTPVKGTLPRTTSTKEDYVKYATAKLNTLEFRRKNFSQGIDCLAQICHVDQLLRSYNDSLVEFTHCLPKTIIDNSLDYFIFETGVFLLGLHWNLQKSIHSDLILKKTPVTINQMKVLKLFLSGSELNTFIQGFYFGAERFPELNQLTSLKVLRKSQNLIYKYNHTLTKHIIFTITFPQLLRLNVDSEFAQVDCGPILITQSQVCALTLDVFSHLKREMFVKIIAALWELWEYPYFRPNKGEELYKIHDLKVVPVKKAQRALEEASKSLAVMEKKEMASNERKHMTASEKKGEKSDKKSKGDGISREKSNSGEASGVERCKKHPEVKSKKCESCKDGSGAQKSGEGSRSRCLCCKKWETAASRFRKGLCSAKCRDKSSQESKVKTQEKKRCGFCYRSQERWRGGEFLTSGERVFCSPDCRDRWRANRGRPYQTGDWDCSHCGRAEREDERFAQCPACVADPEYPEPEFYCSEECRDAWWGVEHQAQHLEFELGLWDLQVS